MPCSMVKLGFPEFSKDVAETRQWTEVIELSNIQE